MPIRFSTPPSPASLIDMREWSEESLTDLVGFRQPPEGVHVEYKHGDWLTQAGCPDIRGEIRRYMAGFANAEGGTLIIGVSDKDPVTGVPSARPQSIAPIAKKPGKAELGAWLQDVLREGTHPQHVPPVRIEAFGSIGREFAVLTAQPTSHELISVRCDGRTVFPARIADSTLDLDEWAVRAIILGSRRGPRVELRLRAEACEVGGGGGNLNISLPLTIFNDGFSFAHSPRWGAVLPARLQDNGMLSARPLGAAVAACSLTTSCTPEHVVYNGNFPDLEPFGSFNLVLSGRLSLATSANQLIRLNLAVYFVAANSLPVWFSVRVERSSTGTGFVGTVERTAPPVPVGFVASTS